MKKTFLKYIVLPIMTILAISPASPVEKIHAAVAANYIQPFRDLAAAFEKETGIGVDATFSSSGNLYSQVTNGAPYDIFLSADQERPARLEKEGLAGKPFVYATGQVVLWTAKKELRGLKDWTGVIRSDSCKRISIANPATAPYGLAAETALRATGLLDTVQPRLVISQDIAMSFQYASTEAVDAGFCSLSAAYSDEGKKGCYYPVSQAPEIVQAACVLKKSSADPAVTRFAAFLVSPEASRIKAGYGYR